MKRVGLLQLESCQKHVLRALREQMDRRSDYPDLQWIDAERQAVAIAANEWATARGRPASMTVDGVKRLEVTCIGHVDYADKLALRVAEEVLA